ncbi:MAG TPA: SpoIIE family protein phosphatase, partial [Herpetosiphonaceae bacterium]|nr:SpoIIE family protein phosphatase [Herpetosiphonaceae bacterium]
MAVQSVTEAYQHLAQAETKSDRERRADFLRLLSLGAIVLLCLAMLIMLAATSQGLSFAIVALAILSHGTIWYLNKQGYVDLAARLFCGIFDLELFAMFMFNLELMQDGDATAADAILMGMAMTLSVLLAGMLISRRTSLYFAAGNTLLILVPYLIYSPNLDDALHSAFPIVGFTWMMALISWLYQRSLANARDRLNAARQEVMRSELLRRDLTIARELQQRLYPAPPTNSGPLTFATLCEPARETSGDFYDFIALEPGVWAIVVADVTGKSLAAAMVMTMTRSIIRSNSQRSLNAAEVIAH